MYPHKHPLRHIRHGNMGIHGSTRESASLDRTLSSPSAVVRAWQNDFHGIVSSRPSLNTRTLLSFSFLPCTCAGRKLYTHNDIETFPKTTFPASRRCCRRAAFALCRGLGCNGCGGRCLRAIFLCALCSPATTTNNFLITSGIK